MAEKKKLKKPGAEVANESIAPCQKGIRIYPARLALKEHAFEKIAKGTSPVLPQTIPTGGEDYDLRRLRDGYVYILAANAQADCFPITGEAANGQAWYIYRYRSDDTLQGFMQRDTDWFENHLKTEQTPEKPQHTENGETSDNGVVNLKTVNVHGKRPIISDYIELNSAIATIHIMYSDIELPYSLLQEMETSDTTRALWMRKINIQSPSGAAADLKQLTNLVADFSLSDLSMENQVTNRHRYTPIGRLKNWQDVANRITYGNGVIIALEDSIGTIRDLACYQGYLDELQEKTLKKYEYAIRTATLIHAYAQEKVLFNFDQQTTRYRAIKDVIENKNPWYNDFNKDYERLYGKPTVSQPVPISLAQSYKQYVTQVAPIHLGKDSQRDIFAALKQELNLEEILGDNAIHKMANLAGLYGRQFKAVVEAHIKLINDNYPRLETLSSLLNKGDSAAVYAANAFCLFVHGLFWGLDISSYGFNASTAALGKAIGTEYKPTGFQVGDAFIQQLQDPLKLFNKSAEMLVTLAKSDIFSIAAYDLVVDILITKHSALANPNNVTKVGKGGHVVLWRRVYEIHPVTGEYSYIDRFVAEPNSMKGKILNAITVSHNGAMPQEYAHFHVGNGLVKLQMLETVIGFFGTQKYRTMEGRLANDPFLAAALTLGGAKSTPILDKFKAKVEESKRNVKIELTKPGGKTHRQNLRLTNFKIQSLSETPTLRQIAGRLVSANTALVFLNSLVEYGNWYESRYKGDALGQNAAMLRGIGGLTAGTSYGVLGLLAGKTSAAATLAVVGATVGLWVGLAAVVIGTILGFLSKEDMDSWIENGFWGKSPYYWGEPVRGYEWVNERLESFNEQNKRSIFQYIEDNSGTTISPSTQNAYHYYEIEMQRYFAFKENIRLSKYADAPHAVLVEHPSINNDAMAQSIRLDTAMIIETAYIHYVSAQKPQRIEFIENGKAVLHFPTPWEGMPSVILDRHSEYPRKEVIDERAVKSILLKVTLADYQGSKETIRSDRTRIPMK